MTNQNQQYVEAWASAGLNCSAMKIFKRPSAQSDPNTYVFLFESALKMGDQAAPAKNLSVDVHYEGQAIEAGRALKAIGGLWVKDVTGDMKPQQHNGILLQKLMERLPHVAPARVDGTYGF